MWHLSSDARSYSARRARCNEGPVNEATKVAGGKPRELQGWSNRILFHPLAQRLARALVPTSVTPNMVSVSGAAMVTAAGALYAFGHGPGAILLGFAIHLAWHVVDGADGALARLSGRASASGEVVDGLCDYLGHALLYTMLAMRLDDTLGPVAWAIVAAAGVSRAVQSVFAESQRRTYQWWAYGVPWLQTTGAGAAGGGTGGRLTALYLGAWRAMSGPTLRVDALVASAVADPTERARIARIARGAGQGMLRLTAPLGANARTMLLGLSMLAGGPLPFLLLELVVLNVLLIVAILQARASARHIAALIARGGD